MEGTSSERARSLSSIAETYWRIGEQAKAQELLREAKQWAHDADDNLPPGMPTALIDIALAMSKIGYEEQALWTWLTEANLARVNDHVRVLMAISGGLECLTEAKRSRDVRSVAHVLMEFEETWPLA